MSVLSEEALRSAELGVGPADESPLTEEERRMVIRLLSDPFAFPQVFKTWLISFLEGSDLSLPLSSVTGLTALLGVSGAGSGGVLSLLPKGLMIPFGGPNAPEGSLLCNGQAVSRVQYKGLFDVIGTAFGGGDGSTSFNVPDMRNRLMAGVGPGSWVGASEGQSNPSLRSIYHRHSVIDNGHTHGFYQSITAGSSDGNYALSKSAYYGTAGQITVNQTGIRVGQDAHPAVDAPSHLYSNWIIVT